MAGGRYKDDINSGLYPTYVEPETAGYQQYRSLKSNVGDVRRKGIQQAQALTPGDDMGVTPQAAREGEDYRVAQQAVNEAWNIARLNKAREQGTMNDFVPTTYGFGIQRTAIPTVQREQPQAPVTQTQRATGGGQAIAAENPDQQQQPAGNPQAPGGVPWLKSAVPAEGADAQWNVASRGRDGQPDIQTATVGDTQYWQMEGGVASKKLNQQPRAAAGQSRPGLGLNGMRDLGNGQVAVGQVDGFQNPGYGFKGSREDAERFFQPVGRPGGYNPYRVDVGPTLFNRLQEERRAAKATPQPAEQGPMGWKRLRDQMNNESRERIAEMTGGFGLTQAGLQDARAREQLAQQYGINMAQLGNDNLRTQAALGLSGLQQQQAMQQMRQQQMLDNARQTYATARPGSQEWIQARNTMQAYRQGGENEQKPFEIGEDVDPETGSKTKRYGIRTEDGIMPLQVTGGQDSDPYALTEKNIIDLASSPAGQKAIKDGKWDEFVTKFKEEAKKRK